MCEKWQIIRVSFSFVLEKITNNQQTIPWNILLKNKFKCNNIFIKQN